MIGGDIGKTEEESNCRESASKTRYGIGFQHKQKRNVNMHNHQSRIVVLR